MGWFDKDSNKTATSTTSTTLPSWVDNAAQDNVNLANSIASQPYTPYTGARQEGFNADQTQVFDNVRNLQGTGAAAMQPSIDTTNNLMGYNSQQIQAGQFNKNALAGYMNPYLDAVEGSAMQSMNMGRLQALNRTGDQAASQGAFGGSRHGVMEGVTNSETARQMGDLSNNIRSQGYNAATGLMTADMDRALKASGLNQTADIDAAKLRLAAAGQGGTLAGQERALTAQEIAMQEATGKQQQAFGQQGKDIDYQNYVEQKSYPTDMLNIRMSALGMSPYGKTNTSTTPVTGSNALMTGLGAASTAASVAGALAPAQGWGSAIKSLLS